MQKHPFVWAADWGGRLCSRLYSSLIKTSAVRTITYNAIRLNHKPTEFTRFLPLSVLIDHRLEVKSLWHPGTLLVLSPWMNLVHREISHAPANGTRTSCSTFHGFSCWLCIKLSSFQNNPGGSEGGDQEAKGQGGKKQKPR